jgi:hypothetical protein
MSEDVVEYIKYLNTRIKENKLLKTDDRYSEIGSIQSKAGRSISEAS